MNKIKDTKEPTELENVWKLLQPDYLEVAGGTLSLKLVAVYDALQGSEHTDNRAAADEILSRASQRVAGGVGLASPSGGAGLLHKALHKSLHKSLHKGLHKGLHKAVTAGAGGGVATGDLSWPTIEVPWRELGRLYDQRDVFSWDRIPPDVFPPPPSVAKRLGETADLLKLQEDLRKPDNAFRRDRIRVEASNDLTAYMLPLGADVTTPGSRTAIMFQTILWLGSLIGLLYKERFNAPRPHVINPRLEPFIPVPAYSSYPSNHAFQSFLIAEVFSRAVPEHHGGDALYRAAAEVARNREWAGLHVKSDTDAGQLLARLCAPVFEIVLEDQIRAVRAEWLGEGMF